MAVAARAHGARADAGRSRRDRRYARAAARPFLPPLLALPPGSPATVCLGRRLRGSRNPTLQLLAGPARIWLEPGAVPQYYLLTFTTLWLNYQIGGAAPFDTTW